MTLDEDREALVTALRTAPGIKSATAKPPTSVGPGVAWPVLVRLKADLSGIGYLAEWVIMVVLPQAVIQADEYAVEYLPGWLAALRPEMSFTEATPAQITIANSTLPAFALYGVREAL